MAPLALLALLGAAAGAAGPAAPTDWPQWGGPLRNGVSPVTGIFTGGSFRLREIWRQPVGEGISAPVAAGERLFFLAAEGDGRFAVALDAGTGRVLWRHPLAADPPSLEFGPASTPATDGRLVFVLSPACQLMALAAEDGRTRWQRDLKAEFHCGPMAHGCWTSPLLEGDRVLLMVNGEPDQRVVAFAKESGAVVWSAAGSGRVDEWTSPAVADLAGERQLLLQEPDVQAPGGLDAWRAGDGAPRWSIRFAAAGSYSHDMPIAMAGDRIAVVEWSSTQALGVRRQDGRLAAALLWSSPDIRAEVQPFTLHAVYHDGYLYGFGGDFLVCLDEATGKTVWREKVYPGSLILADGHLIVLSQSAGLLRVVEATPAGYREKARAPVFNPGAPTDTPPSLAGRRIFLRNSEQLVALEVVRQQP